MEQLEKDYLDLKQKYDKLNKHAAKNHLGMSLLIWLFVRGIPGIIKNEDKAKLLKDCSVLIIESYMASLAQNDQLEDLEEMKNTSANFFEELNGGNMAKNFVTTFIKKVNNKKS